MRTYGRQSIAFVRGEGTRVWDSEGNAYLDFVTGLAVTSLGHCHPEVVKALEDQAHNIWHTSNLYWIEPQVRLAGLLTASCFADKVFFCNSGAEANEGALKLARKFASRGGRERAKIVSLKDSFHGRTLATLAATGQTKYQHGFGPLPTEFAYVEREDEKALAAVVDEQTAALFLEPVQGEGGVHPLSQGFLTAAARVCKERGALLIFDEVQCGMGRTGELFAHQHYGIEPDIMTLAKALGNGIPIGAVLAREEVAAAFQPGDHASTFGGNFLSAAVGCKVMEIMTAPDFLPQVKKESAWFASVLQELSDRAGFKGEVRGLGFILGLPVGDIGPQIVEDCRAQGLLINCVGGETLRFLPPLNVKRQELEEALQILNNVILKYKKG
jgi:acetylornithine aminotransferase